jgi:hypothetical protein
MRLASRHWDDPSLSYEGRVKLITDPSQRIIMSQLLTYGMQDFDRNMEAVEQDLTGDISAIVGKIVG